MTLPDRPLDGILAGRVRPKPNSLLARDSSRLDCLREKVVPLVLDGKGVRQWLLPL